jgi:hypothetical protein
MVIPAWTEVATRTAPLPVVGAALRGTDSCPR